MKIILVLFPAAFGSAPPPLVVDLVVRLLDALGVPSGSGEGALDLPFAIVEDGGWGKTAGRESQTTKHVTLCAFLR